MTTSVAYKIELGRNVSYFMCGWLKSNAAGWTDDKIVEFMTEDDPYIMGPEDAESLLGMDGLKSASVYYLVAVAYDSKGNHGELTKHKFETLRSSANDSMVYFTDVEYDSSKWYWTTKPNATTHKFYMAMWDATEAAVIASYYTEAELAKSHPLFFMGAFSMLKFEKMNKLH